MEEGKEGYMSQRIGREFLEKTKYKYLHVSDQMQGVSPPPLEAPVDKEGKKISLPDPGSISLPDIHLRVAMERRESIRQYSGQYLALEELSYMLWCTQGVKEVMPPYQTLRTVPSAGARHALETYLLINRICGVDRGLYRFMAVDHMLREIDTDSMLTLRVTDACLGQSCVKTSAVTFIWVAVHYRMTWRYSDRGYRYLFIDAGHVCQNLYLSAEAIGCSVCAIGAFSDDDMNHLLRLDGDSQFVIYLATVGRKQHGG
jgi:SagB-type dehydrogenase family enzyme